MGSVVLERIPSTTPSRRSTACVAQSAAVVGTAAGAVDADDASTSPGWDMGGHYPQAPMRPVLALLAAAFVAALAGLISGEYGMASGLLPVVVAVVLGVGLAELVSVIWRGGGAGARAVAAVPAAF